MPKLNPGDHPAITPELIEQILERYDHKSFTSESPDSGIANTTLLISSTDQKVVLRIYQRNRILQDIKLEIAFIELLQRGGIPAATICSDMIGLKIGQIEAYEHAWFYILIEFVQGVHSDEYTRIFIKDLARI
jgi:Ser/Thr protein kinase RdoA (MazF antagonist)